jgi:hypothetical protein
METCKIVIPSGAPQQKRRFDATLVDKIGSDLYELTRLLSQRDPGQVAHGALGGEYGYGAIFENGIFLMHPYCWCDQEDCPWCATCSCDHKYFYGQTQATPDEYFSKNWKTMEKELGERRVEVLRQCDLCKKGGPEPNFLIKESGIMVSWYKYIGRGMRISPESLTLDEWISAYKKVVDSLIEKV